MLLSARCRPYESKQNNQLARRSAFNPRADQEPKIDIDGFCKGIETAIIHEINADANEQSWIYRGETPDIPIQWSVRAGEILYNLRSALDHAVWQLVLANGRVAGQHNQFPIADNEGEWSRPSTQKRLNGLTEQAKARIHYLQPFNAMMCLRLEGIYHPDDAQTFRTLRWLCNIDKHRHLNFILSVTSGIEPIVFGENQPMRRLSTPVLEGKVRKGKIEKDMVLLLLNDSCQELAPKFRIRIGFHHPGEHILAAHTVQDQLYKCLEAVQGGCELLQLT